MRRTLTALTVGVVAVLLCAPASAAIIEYTLPDIHGSVALDTGQTFSGQGYLQLRRFDFGDYFRRHIAFGESTLMLVQANVGDFFDDKVINTAELTFTLDSGDPSLPVTVTGFDSANSFSFDDFDPPAINVGSVNRTLFYNEPDETENILDVTTLLQNHAATPGQWFALHIATSSDNVVQRIGDSVMTLRVDYSQAGTAPIPEPATLTLLGLGVAGLAARRLRTHA